MYRFTRIETETAFKKVNELFNKNEETLNADVETIKKWLQTQPHLPEIMDDARIRNFIVRNKYSIERTKNKIDMYYTIRSLIPDIFDQVNPKLPHNRAFMDNVYCFTLPIRVEVLVEEIHTLCFFKMKESNKLQPREALMFGINITESRLSSGCVFSEIFVIDLATFTLNDIMKMTPSFAMKTMAIYEKAWSIRIKAVYIFNAPSYISIALEIWKAVIKTKIFNRIKIFQDEAILKELFTEDTLPKDYGGTGPSLQELTDITRMNIEKRQDQFDMLDKLRVDESLRPEKLNNDELLGFYGNFKKLSVD